MSILRSLNLNIQPGKKVSNSLSSLPATKTNKHICSTWILRAWNLNHTNVAKVALVGQSGCGKSTVIQLIQVSSSLCQIVILYSSSQTSEVLWLGRGLIGHRGQWYPLTKRSLCKVIHSTLGWGWQSKIVCDDLTLLSLLHHSSFWSSGVGWPSWARSQFSSTSRLPTTSGEDILPYSLGDVYHTVRLTFLFCHHLVVNQSQYFWQVRQQHGRRDDGGGYRCRQVGEHSQLCHSFAGGIWN